MKCPIASPAENQHYSSSADFLQQWVEAAPAGSTAFHAQLFPGFYPSDWPGVQKLIERGRPLEEYLPAEYLDMLATRRAQGIATQRLFVMRGPSDPLYDPAFFERKEAICEPALRAGEVIHSVVLSRWLGRLAAEAETCWPMKGYLDGLPNTPRASFWAVTGPNGAPVAMWLMDYSDDGRFIGGPCFTPPFPPEVERYRVFWHGVFKEASTPLVLPPED